jgi:hypothetical protein
MSEQQSQFPLVTFDGATGVVLRRARFIDRNARSLVRLDDGREFEVPNEALEVRQDGTFLLHAHSPAETEHATTVSDDATDSRPDTRTVSRIETESNGRNGDGMTPATEHTLYTEEADVRRVPVNRIVTEVPQTRQEGEVTIVPVLEEVLVVEKRLLLKEEIHIVRRRAQVREPRRIPAEELRS